MNRISDVLLIWLVFSPVLGMIMAFGGSIYLPIEPRGIWFAFGFTLVGFIVLVNLIMAGQAMSYSEKKVNGE
jgi:hypothetical protein